MSEDNTRNEGLPLGTQREINRPIIIRLTEAEARILWGLLPTEVNGAKLIRNKLSQAIQKAKKDSDAKGFDNAH